MRKPFLYCVLLIGFLTLLPAKQAKAGEVWGISIVGYNRESREIFGLSATWLDFDAAYYYDPAVQGELYWQFNNEVPLDSGYSEGYGVFPATVWLFSPQYLPLTTYSTFSNHFVIAYYTYCVDYCNYYYWYDPFRFDFFGGGDFGGWYYYYGPYFDPYCYTFSRTIYMFSTGASIRTPPDGCFTVGADFLTTGTPCVPEPTPTPTPTPSPTQCLTPGLPYRTEAKNNGIPFANPNAPAATATAPYRNSTVIIAAGTPAGGQYQWTTNSNNKVQLTNRVDTPTSSQITVKALAKSDARNDVVIDVTYTHPNCTNPRTEHIQMTVQQPTEMRYVSTEYNRRLAPFIEPKSGRLMQGWEKRIVWQIYDQFGNQAQPITYRLPVVDTVTNDVPNSCFAPQKGEGTELSEGKGSDGFGQWPHRYAGFSTACLQGGNCSILGIQEYTVNGWVLSNDKKHFHMRCDAVFVQGDTANEPPGSLIPPVPPDNTPDFVDNFYVSTLQVFPDDVTYQSWTNTLNTALAQGPSALLVQARALGRSLFQSAAYISRNRTNEEYVTDLYNAYLGRVPDPDGYAFWLSVLQSDNAQGLNGREHLILGFELSPEFINLVGSLAAQAPVLEACDSYEEQSCINNYGTWDADTCTCTPGCNPYDQQACWYSYGYWDPYSCTCYY